MDKRHTTFMQFDKTNNILGERVRRRINYANLDSTRNWRARSCSSARRAA